MRILWLAHFLPFPPRGGAPQRSYHLLKEVGREAEVHLAGVSLRGHQPRPDDYRRACEALSEICASVRATRASLRSAPVGKLWAAGIALATGRSYGESWLASRSAIRIVADAAREISPDLVHVDSLMGYRLIPASFRGPAVLNHHNVESHMMERRAAVSRGPWAVYLRREASRLAALERSTAKRFAAHITVSDLDRERLALRAPGARYEVVPNGVDIEYFRPVDAEESRGRLVFAGRMNWYPNDRAARKFLEDLWPAIRSRAPGARLEIVGMNPTARLRSVARAHPDVEITGFVEDVRPHIASAAVYVCPILDGGGTRLKLLDAMAMGKAIVSTPMAAEGIEVRDGEEMMIRDFGHEFVDAVVGLLEDPSRRRELGRRARDRAVSSYGWRSIGRRLVDLYRDLIEGRDRRPGEAR